MAAAHKFAHEDLQRRGLPLRKRNLLTSPPRPWPVLRPAPGPAMQVSEAEAQAAVEREGEAEVAQAVAARILTPAEVAEKTDTLRNRAATSHTTR